MTDYPMLGVNLLETQKPVTKKLLIFKEEPCKFKYETL